MTATTEPARCTRCRRPLRSAASVAAGYGPTCIRRERADLGGFTPEQTAKAARVVEAGNVTKVRGGTDALFRVRGTYATYWTSYTDCSCEGARDRGSCYHIASVRLSIRPIVTAARAYVTAA